jgi:hypothetical protein
VKLLELVAVPAGVVTLILPVVAPEGTFVVILVPALFTEKEAVAVRLNLTWLAPVKLVPLMVTEVPIGPLVGENEVMVGSPVTVKLLELVAVPAEVVTLILPVVAPEGTFVVILVPALFTEKEAAAVWLNFTWLAPVKLVPLMLTEVPIGPLVGENEVMVGKAPAPVTVKLLELVAVPAGVVTLILPVVAPDGTVVVSCVPEGFHENDEAFVLLNFTAVVLTNLVPLIVTEVPIGPLIGERPVMSGAQEELTVKSSTLVPVPSGLVTAILPFVAPVGTVVVILPSDSTFKVVWSTPLNSTRVAPVKWSPRIVTEVPTGPQAGVKLLTVGFVAACAVGIPTRTKPRVKATSVAMNERSIGPRACATRPLLRRGRPILSDATGRYCQ